MNNQFPVSYEPRMLGSGYKNRVQGKPYREPRKIKQKDGTFKFDSRDVMQGVYVSSKTGEHIKYQQNVTGRYGDPNYSDYGLKRAKFFKGVGAGKFQSKKRLDKRNVGMRISNHATVASECRRETRAQFLRKWPGLVAKATRQALSVKPYLQADEILDLILTNVKNLPNFEELKLTNLDLMAPAFRAIKSELGRHNR